MGRDLMVRISVVALWDLNIGGFKDKMVAELKIPSSSSSKKFHELTSSVKKKLMDNHYGKDVITNTDELDKLSKSLKVK